MLPQNLDAAACYKMLRSRDARFDGRFFVGVSSTRIYCRPICTARTPRIANCAFFSTAAAAERHGYRPCLRCRPELAPGYASTEASARLAQAAAALVDDGALDDGDVGSLASRLGVTDRHLRRIFDRHFGVTPLGYARTQRLLLAKRLLTDTRLPVTEVALASGFSSLRRFNDSFVRSYRLSPTDLRRSSASGKRAAASRRPGVPVDEGSGAAAASVALRFRLAYRPPFEWDGMAGFLAMRAIEGVESVEAESVDAHGRGGGLIYRRILRLRGGTGRPSVQPERPEPTAQTIQSGRSAQMIQSGRSAQSGQSGQSAQSADRIGWVEVRGPSPRQVAPVLHVSVDTALTGSIPAVLARVRRVFDLACRPDEIAAVLGELVRGQEGMRLPGAFDGFEMAVRAILGQQITVKAARTLAGRFVRAFGEPVASPWPTLTHAFPSAASIASRDSAEIASIGLTGQRARTIVALAEALASGELSLEADADVSATIARLRKLPGIGEWTAQYLAMRALGWPDAFLAADVGVMKALGTITARATAEAAEAWRPWRAYAVIHLWTRLASAGVPGGRP